MHGEAGQEAQGIICISDTSWVVTTYITNKRGKVKQKKKVFIDFHCFSISLFPFSRKMYNLRSNFLGERSVF